MMMSRVLQSRSVFHQAKALRALCSAAGGVKPPVNGDEQQKKALCSAAAGVKPAVKADEPKVDGPVNVNGDVAHNVPPVDSKTPVSETKPPLVESQVDHPVDVLDVGDVGGILSDIDWKSGGENAAIVGSLVTLTREGSRFAVKFWNSRGVTRVVESGKELKYVVKSGRLLRFGAAAFIDKENHLVFTGFKKRLFGKGLVGYYRRVKIPTGCYGNAKIDVEFNEEFKCLLVSVTNFTKSESNSTKVR